MNEQERGLSGWTIFASVMLCIGGIMNAIYGMVAIVNDTWIVWSNQEALLVDFTAWGWILFTFGVVAVIAGLGLLIESMAARVAAVVLASLSLIANFLFLPAFPLWGAHGHGPRRTRDLRGDGQDRPGPDRVRRGRNDHRRAGPDAGSDPSRLEPGSSRDAPDLSRPGRVGSAPRGEPGRRSASENCEVE